MSLIKKGTVAGITAVLLCVSFLFAACGESESDAGNQYTLNYAQLSLKIGESERLELSGNGMIILEGIEWSSSVVSVATVDENGRVQAVGTGETVITAAYGGAGYTCSVTVDEIQTIALSETEFDRKGVVGNVRSRRCNCGRGKDRVPFSGRNYDYC